MDDRLETMYERFTWRILSNYVSPWEFEQLRQEITDYEQWCGAWSAQARSHIERGDAALAAGRRLTAGDAYLRAGLFYHWASFMFSHDQDQYRAALKAMAAVWQRAAPLLDPPMSILEVPFENLTLPGYLRTPAGVTRPPVVIMFPGGDSVKEELYNLGDYIVARGPGLCRLRRTRPGNGEHRRPAAPGLRARDPGGHRQPGRPRRSGHQPARRRRHLLRRPVLHPYGRDRRPGRRGGVDLELVHPGRPVRAHAAAAEDRPVPAPRTRTRRHDGVHHAGWRGRPRDCAAAAGVRRPGHGLAAGARRADRGRIRRPGDQCRVRRRRAHPEQHLLQGPAAWWPTGWPKPSPGRTR